MAVLAGPAVAAEDPLLAQMAGDWIGRGTFKASPTAKPELVYCKVNNSLGQGGATLQQKGRCAVATNSGRVSGKFDAKGGGVYQGSLESLSTRGPAEISGTASGNQIAFEAQFVDRKTKKPGTAAIQMTIGDGAYRVVSKRIDPKTSASFVTSDIKFARQ